MDFGTLLRKLRDSRGLSTRAVAEKAGISHSTYMDWEHDKSSPSLRLYIKLSHAMDLDPVEFMAYLTGNSKLESSSQERAYIADLKEMLKYYKDYNTSLEKDRAHAESELSRIKNEINSGTSLNSSN